MLIDVLRLEMCIRKRLQHRPSNELYESRRGIGRIDACERANRNRDQGIDDALAQLDQMLEERHLRAAVFLGCACSLLRRVASGHGGCLALSRPFPPVIRALYSRA